MTYKPSGKKITTTCKRCGKLLRSADAWLIDNEMYCKDTCWWEEIDIKKP